MWQAIDEFRLRQRQDTRLVEVQALFDVAFVVTMAWLIWAS